MKSGIYVIKGPGKVYVGQSQNIGSRRNRHFGELRRGVHSNKHMQAAWNLYGEQAFSFETLEDCAVGTLDERELFWITELRAVEAGYNKRVTPVSNRGIKFSEEIRAKVGAAIKAALASPQARARIKEVRKRTFSDPALRARISENSRRYYADPEARAKQSKVSLQAHSRPGVREKLSDKAKAAWADPITRSRQAAAIKAAHNTPEILLKKAEDAKRQMRGRSKLSLEVARDIRRRYVPGCSVNSAVVMARELGVSPCTISAILKHRIWRE